tara:strand:- start:1681 stop:2640 length:960 start_codon:yes stop_codon:yes gene_type:complete
MAIQITPLPYNTSALEPVISEEALRTHYEQHYKGYVAKLNDLIPDTIYEDLSLKDIVLRSGKKIQWDHEVRIFNNADQAWNHTFFWNCLTPARNMRPSDYLAQRICENFGSIEAFQEQFNLKALELFGSGWLWLVLTKNNTLEIMVGKNDENPMASGYTPIFVVDLWEHAYYLDYQSKRKEYVENIWQLVNWSFVHAELVKAEKHQPVRKMSKENFQSLPFYFRQRWVGSDRTFIKRRRTSVASGSVIGATIGAVLFFFLASLVSMQIIPLPGLVNSSEGINHAAVLLVGVSLGIFVGAACGALVGIGTPMPLTPKPNH